MDRLGTKVTKVFSMYLRRVEIQFDVSYPYLGMESIWLSDSPIWV